MSAAPELTEHPITAPAGLAGRSACYSAPSQHLAEHRTAVGEQHTAPLLRPVSMPVSEPPFDDELGVSVQSPAERYGCQVAGGVFAVAAAGGSGGSTAWSHPPTATVARGGAPAHAPAPPIRQSRPSPTLRVLPGGRAAPVSPERPESLAELPGPLLGIVSTVEDRDDEPDLRRIVDLPDPKPLAGQLAQAVVEVLAGDRPITQLLTWLDERIYTELSSLAPRPRTSPSLARSRSVLIRPQDRPKVRSIHVCRPADGVAEIAARVQVNGRSRAVALRLEEWRGRWRCSALVVG